MLRDRFLADGTSGDRTDNNHSSRIGVDFTYLRMWYRAQTGARIEAVIDAADVDVVNVQQWAAATTSNQFGDEHRLGHFAVRKRR